MFFITNIKRRETESVGENIKYVCVCVCGIVGRGLGAS